MRVWLLVGLLGLLSFGRVDASAAAARSSTAPPSLFLSCPLECFDEYLRQELSYFDFSHDPYRAELTIVVVRQRAGNGGEQFTVTLARREAAGASASSSFAIPSGTPHHTARQRLLQTILRKLRHELQNTQHEVSFELTLPRRDGATLSALPDPWNYWVITPEINGEAEGGSGHYHVEGTGAVTVRRVTEPSKLRLRGAYVRRWNGYLLEDGAWVRGDVDDWALRALYAHSLGRHWSLGGVATGRGSEFENLSAHLHGGPLVEFNLFPYSENASRQFRLAYQAGAWANWYLEVNESDLLREVRPYHAFSAIADVNQPWGSLQWIGQVNQFLDAPGLYRLSTGVSLSFRLFEGLAVGLGGEAAWVRDQINLRRRSITDEEVLLWTVEQSTGYVFDAGFTVSYTFGSRHDTIVNPRFGRVDLDEE